MNKQKLMTLRKKGWATGSTIDFLGLSPEEAAYVETRVSLTLCLKKKRKTMRLTQEEFAQKIHSSQSRVSKIEKCDPTVTLDLIVKSLFALGISREEVAEAIA